MTATTIFDRFAERVTAGDAVSSDEIRELAATPDILSLGMLADIWRRRLHETRTTFLRVAETPFERGFADGVPASARELRLTGSPADVAEAVRAIQAVRLAAPQHSVAALSWSDVERWSGSGDVLPVLKSLRAAGLDSIADLPLDAMADADRAIASLASAGYERLRLTIDKAPAAERTSLLIRAGDLARTHGCIQAISPLPMVLGTFRPTTGYEDVKMVAIARLAAPAVPSIQVDWRRYGPKLAQVALTFGADDVDGVSASEDSQEGRRRTPLAEIQRNIEAAGFVAAERDGRFRVL